jgi:hypothetical protein
VYITSTLVKISWNLSKMKYGLTIADHLFGTYGKDIGLGYDIMCAFIKPLHISHLQKNTRGHQLIGVVPAFHGHAHNRKCQVHWHPMYIDGVGTGDFKECERTFFGSNNLTNVTVVITYYIYYFLYVQSITTCCVHIWSLSHMTNLSLSLPPHCVNHHYLDFYQLLPYPHHSIGIKKFRSTSASMTRTNIQILVSAHNLIHP